MTESTLEQKRKTILADLRAAMNGVASKAIRESGMGYQVNFGVELPRLRQIATEFTPDRHLAQMLWQENIRECRLLAIMLYPREEFDSDMADIWVEQLLPEHAELAQLMVMDLIAQQPYASEKAFQWMASDKPVYQLCGFLIINRLLMQGALLSPDAEAKFKDQAAASLATNYLPLRKAILNALTRLNVEL